jgi:hypothetical protein
LRLSPTYVLFDPAVEQAVGITREQQEQLQALSLEIRQKARALQNPATGQRPNFFSKEYRQAGSELSAERDRKINEIMTKAQQDQFAELIGKPFDIRLLLQGQKIPAAASPARKDDDKK